MQTEVFFAEHPVFRHDELVDYIMQQGKYNPNSLKALLQYHLAKEHISRIRRGYYAVTSSLKSRGTVADDPILIAGRVSEDSIIGHHSALTFHALAYSLSVQSYFFAHQPMQPFQFMQVSYQRVAHPKSLEPNQITLETKKHDRQGLDITVTTVERTLVDCLDKPQFSGGWEEIWRAGKTVDFLDVDRMINYAISIANATTVAKVGFFLEQYQKQFSVSDNQLGLLEKHKPKSKHYMDRNSKKEYKYLNRWNLIVPLSVINKTWEESNHDLI